MSGPRSIFFGLFCDPQPVKDVVNDAPRSIVLYRESWEKLLKGQIWGCDGAIATHALSYESPLRAARDAAVNTAVYSTGLFMITGPEAPKNAARSFESMMAHMWGVEDKSGVVDWNTAITSSVNNGLLEEGIAWAANKKRFTDLGFTNVRDINELVNAHKQAIEKEYEKTGTPVTMERFNELLKQQIKAFQDKYGSQVGFAVTHSGEYYVLTEDPVSRRPKPMVGIVSTVVKAFSKGSPFDIPIADTDSVYDRLAIKGGITPKAVMQWYKSKVPTGPEYVMPETMMELYFKTEGRNKAIVNDKGQIMVYLLPMMTQNEYVNEGKRAPTQAMRENRQATEQAMQEKKKQEQKAAQPTTAQKLSTFFGKQGGMLTGLGVALAAAGFLIPGGWIISVVGGLMAAGGLLGKDMVKAASSDPAVSSASGKKDTSQAGKAATQPHAALMNNDKTLQFAKQNAIPGMRDIEPDMIGRLGPQPFFMAARGMQPGARLSGVAA